MNRIVCMLKGHKWFVLSESHDIWVMNCKRCGAQKPWRNLGRVVYIFANRWRYGNNARGLK